MACGLRGLLFEAGGIFGLDPCSAHELSPLLNGGIHWPLTTPCPCSAGTPFPSIHQLFSTSLGRLCQWGPQTAGPCFPTLCHIRADPCRGEQWALGIARGIQGGGLTLCIGSSWALEWTGAVNNLSAVPFPAPFLCGEPPTPHPPALPPRVGPPPQGVDIVGGGFWQEAMVLCSRLQLAAPTGRSPFAALPFPFLQ